MPWNKWNKGLRVLALFAVIAGVFLSDKQASAQQNMCLECVAMASSAPDKFQTFQAADSTHSDGILQFAVAQTGALFFGERVIPANAETLEEAFRAFLLGDSTVNDFGIVPIQRAQTSRAAGSPTEQLRIGEHEDVSTLPWGEDLELPSVGPIANQSISPTIRFSESVPPQQILRLLTQLGSVLDDLRDELCDELVGYTYKEIIAEVSGSQESNCLNVLEYVWSCFPAIHVDQIKHADPACVEEPVDTDDVYMLVERMPAIWPCTELQASERNQCTQSQIIDFVSKNTVYPPPALAAGIQGTVFVYFVIGKDGKVRYVKVLRQVHPLLDAEAVRVVKSLPEFEPAWQRGKYVNVTYTIPVKFIIPQNRPRRIPRN